MPKLKTCKTAAKRFSKSGTGKLMRNTTGMNHLKMAKSKSALRRLSKKGTVTKGFAKVVKKQVPGLA
ncbi:MAG: 50S ribosomal protein L35 [Abditibacteriota bacterium]|nr:50S ribosomal protein L35 [Abditibacteriota bacterium]